MTNEKAIRILTRLQICADTDACDADCEACQFNDDNDEIHEAIDVAIDVLKNKQPEILQSGLQSAT